MELYDAIFYRKSTRKYSNKKVVGQLMEEVKKACDQITYLNEALDIRANVVERGHLIHLSMGKKCKVKSPHYIVVTSKKGDDYLENIGFAIEEVVLQLTTLGLATCWLECDIKRDDIIEFIELKDLEYNNEDYLGNEEDDEEVRVEAEAETETETEKEEPFALIAFGYPEQSELLFRREEKHIDRKNIKQICKKLDKKYEKIVEAVRLSPSGKNCQPWVLYNNSNGFNLYEENQKKNIRDISKISIGISLKHLDIACKKYEIPVKYEKNNCKKKIGKKYYISAILK